MARAKTRIVLGGIFLTAWLLLGGGYLVSDLTGEASASVTKIILHAMTVFCGLMFGGSILLQGLYRKETKKN